MLELSFLLPYFFSLSFLYVSNDHKNVPFHLNNLFSNMTEAVEDFSYAVLSLFVRHHRRFVGFSIFFCRQVVEKMYFFFLQSIKSKVKYL
jgi:hypothetical protein